MASCKVRGVFIMKNYTPDVRVCHVYTTPRNPMIPQNQGEGYPPPKASLPVSGVSTFHKINSSVPTVGSASRVSTGSIREIGPITSTEAMAYRRNLLLKRCHPKRLLEAP